MISRFLYIIFFLLFAIHSGLYAQNKVEIFADLQNNDSLKGLVTILAEQLKKAIPGEYSIKPASSYKGTGIYLALATIFSKPVKAPAKLLQSNAEAFSIKGDGKTIQILGKCNSAISHGVFSYLDLIGFRFYFANKEWHIVPERPRLFQKLDIVSAPSFNHRRIWYGYGTGSKIADADYNFWVRANRLGGSINASFGHSYGNIIARNRDEFAKHPEWFYPKATPGMTYTGDEKFDVSNEELIQFLIRDTEKQIELSLKNKTDAYKMISLAPSDGVGTCNTPACQKLGTITDRVLYPVNRVAKAIQKKYPSTMIGCLAYGEYIPPPTKKIESNVFIGITTAFNTSKFTTEQLVEEWRKKGAFVGIYNYFSWFAWDYDLPGLSHASRTTEITDVIKKYHTKGVRAYEGESSQGWISKGLGYYLAAKQMWDVKANTVAARNEFFKLCFRNASGLMQKMWGEWEKYSFKAIRENDLARWIDYTTEAARAETREAVRKRLFQVKSYLHYLFLYQIYAAQRTEANLLAVLSYGYRKLDDGSVAGFPAFYELGNRSGIEGMAYGEKAKWRTNGTPMREDEIDKLVADDRRKLKINEPIKEYMVAAKLMNVPDLKKYERLIADSGQKECGWWFTNEWVIEIKKKGSANYIDFSGNHLANEPEVIPVRISVYPYKPDGNTSGQPTAFYYEYTDRRVRKQISLTGLTPGFYTVIIEDPGKAYQVSFSPAVNFSQVVRPSRIIRATAFNYSFIYVPEGVKHFNIIKTKTIDFVTPTGRRVSLSNNKPEDLQVEVLKGEVGLWRVKLYDEVFFEGIPPYISTSAKQMLIPAVK